MDETLKIISGQAIKKNASQQGNQSTEDGDPLDQLINRYSMSGKMEGISIGMILHHKTFGEGVVVDYDYPLMSVDFGGVLKKMNYEFCLKQRLIEF